MKCITQCLRNRSGKIFLKLYPGVGLVELSGASLQEEEEEEVYLVGVIPVVGQVVLSAVSETSVVPLPTSLPSDMLSDLVFTE